MSLMYSTHALGLGIAVMLSAKTIAWFVQLRTQNAGLVDPIWSWTLGFLAVLYALMGTAPPGLRIVLALMGGLWGLRLGLHLWVRNWGKPEDKRYHKFREKWGAKANFNMFFFFQFQNIFTFMLSTAAFVPVAFRDDAPPLWCFALALILWNVSVIGEGIADTQMERFRAKPDNKGKVCRAGLWRYSRHPNYFFECVHWAAYVPLAFGAPYGWISLAGPVIMSLMLMKLSGVPLLEEDMVKRKPDYAEYMRTTNALIPWPPKSG